MVSAVGATTQLNLIDSVEFDTTTSISNSYNHNVFLIFYIESYSQYVQ